MKITVRWLITLVLLTLTLSLTAAEQGFKNLKVPEFDKMRAAKGVVVLDVRTADEFKDGHMPEAVNVDVNSPDFEKKMEAMDKSKTYLVHCAGGGRSVTACGKLNKLKFPTLFNLEGGYRAWRKAGNEPAK